MFRRFPLAFAGLLALSALASPAAQAQAAREDRSLPIPVPPNAKVRFEVNAADDDLLGVVKSLLKGVNGQTLMGLMSSLGSMGGPGMMPMLPGGIPGAPGTPAGPGAMP